MPPVSCPDVSEIAVRMLRNTQLMQLSEEDIMEWVDLLYKISDHKVSWGSCEHLLYVGRMLDKGQV